MFHLAQEWGRATAVLPKVKMLAGEKQRDRVLTHEEERKNMDAATEVGRGSGCARKNATGSDGKTSGTVPLRPSQESGGVAATGPASQRVLSIPEMRCAASASGHIEASTLKKRTRRLGFGTSVLEAACRVVIGDASNAPACTGPTVAQTPPSPYAAPNSADALRISGNAALTGLTRDPILQTRRAPDGDLPEQRIYAMAPKCISSAGSMARRCQVMRIAVLVELLRTTKPVACRRIP